MRRETGRATSGVPPLALPPCGFNEEIPGAELESNQRKSCRDFVAFSALSIERNVNESQPGDYCITPVAKRKDLCRPRGWSQVAGWWGPRGAGVCLGKRPFLSCHEPLLSREASPQPAKAGALRLDHGGSSKCQGACPPSLRFSQIIQLSERNGQRFLHGATT